jgi:uncharacterized sodium:solute symporter family permease YidK
MRSNKQGSSPNQHVKAGFTFATLLPLVYYIPPWLADNVTDNHFYVTVLSLAIIVPVVSYVAMPLFFKAIEIRSRYDFRRHPTCRT